MSSGEQLISDILWFKYRNGIFFYINYLSDVCLLKYKYTNKFFTSPPPFGKTCFIPSMMSHKTLVCKTSATPIFTNNDHNMKEKFDLFKNFKTPKAKGNELL